MIHCWVGIGYMAYPSKMHQCIIQWIGDPVEVMQGETSLTVAAIEAQG
jgi:hypothetical protein